jgi:hypothetical protein
MMEFVIDTGEVAATPSHDIGKWSYFVEEESAEKVRAALTALGFTVEEK